MVEWMGRWISICWLGGYVAGAKLGGWVDGWVASAMLGGWVVGWMDS